MRVEVAVAVLLAIASTPIPAIADEPELSDEELLRQLRPRPAVSFGLRGSPLGGNRENADFTLGGSATFWPVPWIGADVTVLGFPAGGTGNATRAAMEELRAHDPTWRLESIERRAALLVSAAFAPLGVDLAPKKRSGLRLDVAITAGAGVEWDAVEMLAYEPHEACSDRGERAACTPGEEGRALGMEPEPYSRFMLNAAVGPRLHLARWLALGLDLRLLGGPVRVFDDRAPEAVEANTALGSLANRLTCRDRELRDLALCWTAFEGAFTVESGVEFVARQRSPCTSRLSR